MKNPPPTLEDLRNMAVNVPCRYWDTVHKTMYHFDSCLQTYDCGTIIFAGRTVNSKDSEGKVLYEGDIIAVYDVVSVILNINGEVHHRYIGSIKDKGDRTITINKYFKHDNGKYYLEGSDPDKDYSYIPAFDYKYRIPHGNEDKIILITNVFEIDKLEDLENIEVKLDS